MIQIRQGDLVAVRKDGAYFMFAILTKQILFGGHWSFVFHLGRSTQPSTHAEITGPGFNGLVDFIVPKRENRVVRVSRGNDFASLLGPEFLQQQPLKGEKKYQIWRWIDSGREDVYKVHFTSSPTPEEAAAPHYGCIPADFACELAAREWQPHQSMWRA